MTVEPIVIIDFGRNCIDCGVGLNEGNCYESLGKKDYRCKGCRAKNSKIERNYIKQEMVIAYGGKCVCCGISDIEFLTIDHIFGANRDRTSSNKETGSKFYSILKRQGFPQDLYQLLCWNCNGAKRNYEDCCHKIPRVITNIKPNFQNLATNKERVCTNCGILLNNENICQKDGFRLHCFRCKKCQTQYLTYRNFLLKLDIFEHYGNKCVCCGEDGIFFLNIDHINDDGGKHRRELKIGAGHNFYRWIKKNEYPTDNFQILCANCNCSKQFYGYCPHQKEINAPIEI